VDTDPAGMDMIMHIAAQMRTPFDNQYFATGVMQ
jgi:hypothetical protein